MEELYHIVKNRHVFDDKWGKIAKNLNIPPLAPQGIHSSIMCFAGMNSGKINEGIFRYILFGYGYVERFEEFLSIFIKFKVIDKDFNLINWNKHQKSILHNHTLLVDKNLNEVERLVEYKLSLVENEVEYLVDKRTNPKLYQAWYFQRVKKGLSCKASYDVLTQKGYVIETRQIATQPKNQTNEVECIIEKVELVDKKVEKVETQQRTHVENRKEEIRIDNLKKINKKVFDTSKFHKPSIEEIIEYCTQRQNNVDPEAFYHYYEGIGWKVGNKEMKSWTSAIITWEKRSKNNQDYYFLKQYDTGSHKTKQNHYAGSNATNAISIFNSKAVQQADFERFKQRNQGVVLQDNNHSKND
jgi:hypothetical protein